MSRLSLILLSILLILTPIAYAEAVSISQVGISFTVPDDFTRGSSDYGIVEWKGPMKGSRSWSIRLQVTPLMKGFNVKDMYEQDFKTHQQSTNSYSSVTSLTAPGAVGGFLAQKRIDKVSSLSHYWQAILYGRSFQYDFMFFGDSSTFNEYRPVIYNILRSIRITK
ncbi:MAG: hypothetical protein RDV48_16610 [Candidatus Eremiobacteraeota bacterium]|nr:hypothetical protein [Candidatus Eremiobacteraeota bacterium]